MLEKLPLLSKFHVRHERSSFHGLRKSNEGADTDLIYNFAGLCWYLEIY